MNISFPKIKIPEVRFSSGYKSYSSEVSDAFFKDGENYEGIKITGKSFGIVESTREIALLFTIKNKNGASVDLSSFGAAVTSLRVPDKKGKFIDVVHGYSSVTPYEKSQIGHAGGTIGPCANKIDRGRFVLNDIEYKLECNKDGGKTHCHGASNGFDVQNWKSEILKDGIKFSYIKKDMEGGYPGNVKMSVTYKLDNSNRLHIKYHAQSDKDTILSPTNHTYFNLDGAKNVKENSVYDHIVSLPNSTHYTPVNEIAIPTGEIRHVENSVFDLRNSKKIRESLDFLDSGFDHNYCIKGYDGKKLIPAAFVESEKSGIKLSVSTNYPGFQFYTANNLGKDSQPLGKHGKRYEKRSAFCIEPQFFPDAINKFSEKPILKAGEFFDKEIVYSFET